MKNNLMKRGRGEKCVTSRDKFKILTGYHPINFLKGTTPTLGQNRQFQYFNIPCLIHPLILASAATLLKTKGYSVIWKDCIAEKTNEKEFIDILTKEKPNLFVFETKTPVIKQTWELSKKLKKLFPKMILVVVGDHVTVKPSETIENSSIDYVLTGGDYDFSLFDLCESIMFNKKLPSGIWYNSNGKINSTGNFKLNHSLDSLPFIDRELTKWKLYQKEYNIPVRPYAYIMSARDCWYGKCTFCVWPQTLFPSRQFRVRSVENVLDEIGMLIEKYDIKEIFDDSGTFPIGLPDKEWLYHFCNGMIKRGYNKKINVSCNMRFGTLGLDDYKLMKKAGFRLLKFGLESGNQNRLNEICKGISIEDIKQGCYLAKKADLTIHLTAFWWAHDTKEEAYKTYKLVKELMVNGLADVHQFTFVVPYVGTKIYEEALKNGEFKIDPEDYEKYDMNQTILATHMSDKEIKILYKKMYGIYYKPEYIIRTIIKNIKHPIYLLRGLKSVVGHYFQR